MKQETKDCSRCGENKPLSEFYIGTQWRNATLCKTCARDPARTKRAITDLSHLTPEEKKERKKQINAEYRKANRDYFLQYMKAYHKIK